MNASTKRPFSRDQRTTIVYGMLVFVLIVVILQLWLLTATMNAWLGGRRCRRVAGGGGERRRLGAERRSAEVPGPDRAYAQARRVEDDGEHASAR